MRVECAPDGDGTIATVSYRVTPLSDTGREWVGGFDDTAYADMMQEREQRIAASLTRPGATGRTRTVHLRGEPAHPGEALVNQ